MSWFESIFYMIWRGIAIGVLISAPMGPVGILCIQRTLEKGRKAGLYTGIGAALSDLFYSLLTGFGLSFIEEFIERNQNIIQLMGSFVLIAFSIYLFRKSPTSSLRRPVPQGVSAKKNILGGFLFTFSNPLILFLIIGLFARFNFLMPEIKFYHYMLGFIFILAGALGWWWTVTYIIDKVRNRFSFRTMKYINIGIGVVILLFAIVGIVTSVVGLTASEASAASVRHWNERRGYAPFCDSVASPAMRLYCQGAAGDTAAFLVDIEHNDAADLEFSFTAATPSISKNNEWGVRIKSIDGAMFDLLIKHMEGDGLYSPESFACASARLTLPDSTLAYRHDMKITGNFNSGAGANRFRISLRDSELLIRGGRKCDIVLADRSLPDFSPDSIGFSVAPGSRVDISDITLCEADTPGYNLSAELFADAASLEQYLASPRDLTEGFWIMFDHSLDDSLLRPGGEYKLAIVRSAGGYDMLYLSGASVNAGAWRPMMLKGRLTDAGVEGTYNLIWYDAAGKPMTSGLKAQRDSENTITLHFPAQTSTIRLHRTRP